MSRHERDGRRNAGPFSFFNVLTHDPAIVAIGVENYDDMRFKDTASNIRETGDFTVHIGDHAMVEADGGLRDQVRARGRRDRGSRAHDGAGHDVRSPRILEAPAALECRRYMTLEIGRAREIILGEVLGVFVREDLVNRTACTSTRHGMDAVGRLGGHTYTRTLDQFDIRTLSVDEWRARRAEEA